MAPTNQLHSESQLPRPMRRGGRSSISLQIEALTVNGAPVWVHAPQPKDRRRVRNVASRLSGRLGRRHISRSYPDGRIGVWRLT